MKINISIPDLDADFSTIWEPEYKIATKVYIDPDDRQTIIISANRQGLLSLARYLLFLAQPGRYIGDHNHFDDYNSLEKGSVELIIEKIE
jgi:hypothetical protein